MTSAMVELKQGVNDLVGRQLATPTGLRTADAITDTDPRD